MSRETMPRKKYMDAAKVEGPTLVPESAEQVEVREAMEAEAVTVNVETVAMAEAGTVIRSESETVILNDAETVRGGIDAVAEVELTGEDAVDDREKTEMIDMEAEAVDMRNVEDSEEALEKAMESSRSEAETIDRPRSAESEAETVTSILTSPDAFKAMMDTAKDLKFPLNEVHSVVIGDVSYEQFSGWKKQLAEKKSSPKSGLGVGFLRLIGMGKETKDMNVLQDKIDAVLLLEFEIKAKQGGPQYDTSGESIGHKAAARKQVRKARESSAKSVGRSK